MTGTEATTTTTLGADLAARFAAVNAEAIAAVEACTAEQWRRPTAAEGWPVAVVAHHMAGVAGFFAGVFGAVAAGNAEPTALSAAGVDENNARHARDHANADRAETLAELRANGAAAERVLAGLGDDQIAAVAVRFDGHPMTVAELAEGGLIAHFREHAASIRATVAG